MFIHKNFIGQKVVFGGGTKGVVVAIWLSNGERKPQVAIKTHTGILCVRFLDADNLVFPEWKL